MNRRDFVRLGCATVIAAGAGKLRPALAQSLAPAASSGAATASDDGDGWKPKAARARGGFHPANRAHDGRAGPSGCDQHDRLQQQGPRSPAAGARGPARHRRGCERHGRSGIRALAWPVRSLGSGWSGGRRHAPGTAAWPPALSIRGQAGGFAMVPLAHRGHDGSASRRLHRPVRFSHDRFRE